MGGIFKHWKPKTLLCKNPDCDVVFTQEHQSQKYCKKDCGKLSRKDRYKKYNNYQKEHDKCIKCNKVLKVGQIKFCSDLCKREYNSTDRYCAVCDKKLDWQSNRTKTCNDQCFKDYTRLYARAKYRGITIEEAKTLTTYQRADSISDYGITKLKRARQEREKSKEARPKIAKQVSNPKKIKQKKVKIKPRPKQVKVELKDQKCPVCKTIFKPLFDGQRGCKTECEMAIYRHERGI